MPHDPETQEEVPEVILDCCRILCPEEEKVSDDGDGVDVKDECSGGRWLEDDIQVAEGFKNWSK